MEREVFEAFRAEPVPEVVQVVTAEELAEGGDRTLTLGYNVLRETLHVYLLEGEVHMLWYPGPREPVISYRHGLWLPVKLLVPDKRVYPQYTDLAFARLMRERTEYGLPFTTWSEPNREGPFYGRRYGG